MSYASALREELIAGAPRRGCCRVAYLRGLFLNAAATKSGKILLSVSSLAARHEIARVFHDVYRREALAERNTLLFSGEALYTELTAAAPRFVCDSCAKAFLRGAFIAAGTATDPEKAYHFEIRAADEEARDRLGDAFRAIAIPYKVREVGVGYGLYVKNGEKLEDLLAAIGSHECYFHLVNTRITRDIRNGENRATNCVAKNIGKSIDAANRVAEAIAAIRLARRFEEMPDELRMTAILREQNPTASLVALAALHNPSLTKSGLNHRLQKIVAFAEALSAKK
ncbi:MAG: DNA-binding protein WhiA [Clostridia bacterium]|nr:DNA-binding protein WhiA [Clostridia bacterium]